MLIDCTHTIKVEKVENVNLNLLYLCYRIVIQLLKTTLRNTRTQPLESVLPC